MFTFPESYAVDKHGWSPRTIKNYQDTINHFLDFFRKDEFCSDDIDSYKAYLRRHDCRNATIKIRLAAIHAYFIFSKKFELAEYFKEIKYKKEIPIDKTPKITEDIYRRVREYLRERQRHRDALIIDLLYWSGCRVSEALSLKLSSFDFAKKLIKIPQAKTGKLHEARLTTEIVESLDLYKKSTDIKDDLFSGLSRQAVDVMLRRLWHKCGFAEQSAHKFRHNRITEWGRRYPLQLVQVQSGHKSIETLKRYIHLTLDDVANYDAQRHAAEAVAAV